MMVMISGNGKAQQQQCYQHLSHLLQLTTMAPQFFFVLLVASAIIVSSAMRNIGIKSVFKWHTSDCATTQ
jgi:ABC-type Fe3+ transport system permease subunit